MHKDSKKTVDINGSHSSSIIPSKDKQKSKKRRRLENIKVNLTNCKYEVLRRIITDKKYGFAWKIETQSEGVTSPGIISSLNYVVMNDWDLYWCDGGITMRFFQQMRLHQVVNHFPGMNMITRKDTLAQSLKKLQKQEGNEDEYDFFPRTWILPNEAYDLNEFAQEMRQKK